jgi:hypothetical protein
MQYAPWVLQPPYVASGSTALGVAATVDENRGVIISVNGTIAVVAGQLSAAETCVCSTPSDVALSPITTPLAVQPYWATIAANGAACQ